MEKVKKGLMAGAGLAALALGGSAIANAASQSTTTTTSTTPSAPPAQQGYGTTGPSGGHEPRGGLGPHGRHVGANGKEEQALPSDVAAKVAAAAKAKVPGATVERTETDVDHGSPYEAHLRKSDGTELEVLVNKSFQVTAINTMKHP
jgi:hypothetical protein